jgi:hypothetical protein
MLHDVEKNESDRTRAKRTWPPWKRKFEKCRAIETAMKPRHAAALVLVSWYLIMPPSFDSTVPLSKWNIIREFDSADKCRSFDLSVQREISDPAGQEKIRKEAAKTGKPWNPDLAISRSKAAQCVSSDDLRLQRN